MDPCDYGHKWNCQDGNEPDTSGLHCHKDSRNGYPGNHNSALASRSSVMIQGIAWFSQSKMIAVAAAAVVSIPLDLFLA